VGLEALYLGSWQLHINWNILNTNCISTSHWHYHLCLILLMWAHISWPPFKNKDEKNLFLSLTFPPLSVLTFCAPHPPTAPVNKHMRKCYLLYIHPASFRYWYLRPDKIMQWEWHTDRSHTKDVTGTWSSQSSNDPASVVYK
jgi:hypothetical protein